MDEKKRRANRVKVAIPIRVRGMSTQNKFFDEQTETVLVSHNGLVAHLQSLVDLETEVHVNSLKNNIGGTFRATWVNTRRRDGTCDVGLELVESEGDLWEVDFPPEPGEAPAQAWLKCQRCLQRVLTPVPEAEPDFLCDGFLIARPCDRCKATTPWEFSPGTEEAASVPAPAGVVLESAGVKGTSKKKLRKELRGKGRAPLQMQIKVVREKYGTTLEDICNTINLSRHGVYFLSSQTYEVGEEVRVVLPYKEGDVAIPVPARVVRQEEAKDSFYHAVAIQLEKVKK